MENGASYELAQRLREVLFSGRLVANTNYKDQLEHLDYVTATAAVQSLNSIASIVQHIHYYIVGVKKVFLGGELDISDQFSFDFPPVLSEEQWQQFLKGFFLDAEEFAITVEMMNSSYLKKIFVKEKYGRNIDNINLMIEHCYYHLGQIVLLKKMLNG